MSRIQTPQILCVDDDPYFRKVLQVVLSEDGFRVASAESGVKALELLQEVRPDLIILDVEMPELSGHQVYLRLQENKDFANIPTIFLSASEEEKSKGMALALGAEVYLHKPFRKDELKQVVREQIKDRLLWNKLDLAEFEFPRFKEFIFEQLRLTPELRAQFQDITPGQIYMMAQSLKVEQSRISRCIADFFGLAYVPDAGPDMWLQGIISPKFARAHQIAPITAPSLGETFVLSNPFDEEVLSLLNSFTSTKHSGMKVAIIEPKNIGVILEKLEKTPEVMSLPSTLLRASIADIGNHILEKAIQQKASDIHIEPKERHIVVRFRAHGEMSDIYALENETGSMLISRFKVLAGLDIIDRRKPQDGAMETKIDDRSFVLRLATTSTPQGESMIIRLLEPWATPKPLIELGMSEKQIQYMLDFAKHTRGIILIVGPTGAGKTTTTYSLLSQIDCTTRSLISVEDPVEYRIPHANQQQVDVKAGVTFESLLKASVRQDPDILFIGEIRDPPSAKIAIDFASTGHLAISTMHTSNATTALFRLERLDIPRAVMADSILGIVAQRLLKKLCPQCKRVLPISKEETEMIAPFTGDIPARVAHPTGCRACNNSGYMEREAVYEIVKFDPVMADMVRRNVSIEEIREFVKKRGDYLLSQHALEKVKQLLFSPKDVYETLLLEESQHTGAPAGSPKPAPQPSKAAESPAAAAAPPATPQTGTPSPAPPTTSAASPPAAAPSGAGAAPKPKPVEGRNPSILLVEDDASIQILVKTILETAGYLVTTASDGVEALMSMGREKYDLIVSDLMMPNMDGFKLLELKTSKGINTPVIFLTSMARDDYELRALNLGAADYITKPLRRDIFLSRVKRALERA